MKRDIYIGDNLDILRRYIPPESIDLVYLDPPFKSDREYNRVFRKTGARAAAQELAFEDTWEWNAVTEHTCQVMMRSPGKLGEGIAALLLLYYSKALDPVWNAQYLPHRQEYIESHYSNVEAGTGRRYTLGDCMNPNPDRPNLTYEWHGHRRVWRWTKDKMQQLHDEGRLVYTRSGLPRYKRYLDEMPGTRSPQCGRTSRQ